MKNQTMENDTEGTVPKLLEEVFEILQKLDDEQIKALLPQLR